MIIIFQLRYKLLCFNFYLQEKINSEMNGMNYTNLDQRKRELYDKYLDYSNKKVHTPNFNYNGVILFDWLTVCNKEM